MKKIYLIWTLVIFSISSYSTFGQSRNYLLYTEENVTRLKNRVKSDELIEHLWNDQYREAKHLLQKSRLGARDCQLLGLVYRMTGEEKFAVAIKNILLDYTARETWEGEGLLSRTPSWRAGLGTSHTSFYISIGFDCVYNYLTNAERKKIAEGIVRIGIDPAREDWLLPGSSFHTFDTMGHNWWSACVYMAGLSCLAVRNEIPEAAIWAKEIANTATAWMDYSGSVLQNKPPTFDKDGGFYESINYASYGISQYLLFRYAFGVVWPNEAQVELPILDKIGDFSINTTYYVKDGRSLSANFGDSRVTKTGNACVALLWNLGYQKEQYAWYLNHVYKGSDNESLQLNTPTGLALYPKLPDLNPDYLPELPLTHLYEDMGWATLRNSWKENATMLAVKSGFTWNHTHADAGSYLLFHRGKNLIIDSGNPHYSHSLYTKYYCQSEAHNVVLFDGQGQNRRDPYYGVVNPGSLHNLIDGGDFKYLMANATGPYSQILARNYRNFIWVGDVILVIDDLLAHKSGQFEWLLHYNGDSKRSGLDLSIKEGEAEVLVRPLYPETLSTGGLPDDFSEQMRLEEKLGYKDHEPEKQQPYWSISHVGKTSRTKFITAIILKTGEIENNLPTIKRQNGKDFISVSITQNGKTTEVYLNLIADGRLKHRNSVINMNGWETDAYLMAIEYDERKDKTKVENIENVFIGHGSYLRRDKQVLVHALSKYTGLFKDFNETPNVIFDGQSNVTIYVRGDKKDTNIKVNNKHVKGEFDSTQSLIKMQLTK